MYMVKCSLCDQTFDDNDLLVEVQKKRHGEKHLRSGWNNIIGKVKWL